MSVRLIRQILTAAAMLLGIAHLAMAPLAYRQWSLDALWFVSTGLALVLAAALNGATANSVSPGQRAAVLIANIAMAGFFAAAWTLLHGPQVIAGGLIFGGLAMLNLARPATSAMSAG